jgi:acyl-CoA hydrolase
MYDSAGYCIAVIFTTLLIAISNVSSSYKHLQIHEDMLKDKIRTLISRNALSRTRRSLHGKLFSMSAMFAAQAPKKGTQLRIPPLLNKCV